MVTLVIDFVLQLHTGKTKSNGEKNSLSFAFVRNVNDCAANKIENYKMQSTHSAHCIPNCEIY